MDTKSISTEEAQRTRRWFVIDAKDMILGRLCSEIASLLRGKHKVMYTPHVDCGDGVIVINAEGIVLTGAKEKKKYYRHHTHYMGGLKEMTAAQLRKKDARQLILRGVWGMMPKTIIMRHAYRRLRVVLGADHKHEAQRPEPLTFSHAGAR